MDHFYSAAHNNDRCLQPCDVYICLRSCCSICSLRLAENAAIRPNEDCVYETLQLWLSLVISTCVGGDYTLRAGLFAWEKMEGGDEMILFFLTSRSNRTFPLVLTRPAVSQTRCAAVSLGFAWNQRLNKPIIPGAADQPAWKSLKCQLWWGHPLRKILNWQGERASLCAPGGGDLKAVILGLT